MGFGQQVAVEERVVGVPAPLEEQPLHALQGLGVGGIGGEVPEFPGVGLEALGWIDEALDGLAG